MKSWTSVGAAVATLLLTGAGCASLSLPGGNSGQPEVTQVTVNKTSTATNGGSCAVNLTVPHLDSGDKANDSIINALIDVNALVVLDQDATMDLADAVDAYLSTCTGQLTKASDARTLTISNEVGLNEGGLFSIGITANRQNTDTGLVVAFGDLYDVNTGTEYELAELIKDGELSNLYKTIFNDIVTKHASEIDNSYLAELQSVATTGDLAKASELLDTDNIDYIVTPTGIKFPFASEAWVPLETGRFDVVLPWETIDPLLKSGTPLSDWRN